MLPVLALVVSFSLPAVQAAAPSSASPRDALLVSPAWVAQHLKDPDLVLLHVGDKAEYETGHLPGARFVSLQEISVSDRSGQGLVMEMPPAETLRAKLSALGISDRSRIVVYFGKDWVSPAARLVFTLDYAGLGDRVSLLDGGQPAWVRDGQAVTATIPEVKAGTLKPLAIRPLIVTKEQVRDRAGKPGQALIDARNVAFYEGTQTGGGPDHPHRTGHIQGAMSLPFNETTDDRLLLRSNDELKALFTKAGVKPGDTVTAYCHLGQQATAVIFAARTLGYEVRLYDGSFEEWSRFPELPVDNPAATKQK